MKKVSSFVLALVAALVVFSGVAQAQTWNNTNPGNWQSANWGIPGTWPGQLNNNSAVIINPNAALTMNNSAPAFAVGNVDIQNAGGTFTVILNGTGTLTINGDLTVNNNIVIGQGFNVVVNGVLRGGSQIFVSTGASLTLNNTSPTAIQGTLTINDGTPAAGNPSSSSGTIRLANGFNGGVFPTSLFLNNTSFNGIEIGGNMTMPGTFTMTSGPLILNGNLSVNPLGNLQLRQTVVNSLQGTGLLGAQPGGQVTFGIPGTSIFNGGVVPGASIQNPFTGQLNVTTGNVSGTITIGNNGVLNLSGGRAAAPLTVLAGATIRVNNTSPNAIQQGAAPTQGFIQVNAGGTLSFGPGANASILPFAAVTNANGTVQTSGPMTLNLLGVNTALTPFPTTSFTSVLDLGGDLTLANAGTLRLTPLGANAIIGTGRITATNQQSIVEVRPGFNNGVINGNNFACAFNGTFAVSTGANFDVTNTLCVGGPLQLNGLLTLTSNSELRLSSNAPASVTGRPFASTTVGIVALNNTGVVRLSAGFNAGTLPVAPNPFIISTGATAFKGRLVVESNQILARPLTMDVGSILDLAGGNLTVSSGTVLVLNNQGAGSLTGTGFLQGTERNPTGNNTPGIVALGPTFSNGILNTARIANPFFGMLNVSTATALTMQGNLVIGAPLSQGSNLFLGPTQLTIAQNSSLTLNGTTRISNTTASVVTDATLPGFIQGIDCTSRLVLGPQFNNGVITAAGVIAQPFNGGLVINGRGGLTFPMQVTRASLTIGQTGCLTLNDDIALAPGANLVLNNQAAGSLNGTGRIGGPVAPLSQEALQILFGNSQVTLGPGFNGGTVNAANFTSPLNVGLALPISPLNLTGALTMGTTRATLYTQAPGTLTVLSGSSITFTTNANAIWGGGRLAGTDLTSQFNLGNGNGFNSASSGYGLTAGPNSAASQQGATGINATQFVQPFVGTMNIAAPPVNTNRPVYITSGNFTFAPNSILNLFGPIVVTDATVPTPSSINLNMTAAGSLSGTTLGTVTGASVAVAINIGTGFNGGIIDGRRFGPTTPQRVPFVGSLRFPASGTFRLSASLTTATVPAAIVAADGNAIAGEIQLNGSTLLIDDAIQLVLSAQQAPAASVGTPRITATAGGGLQGATNQSEVIVPVSAFGTSYPAITAGTFQSPFNGRLSLGSTNPLNVALPIAPDAVAFSLPNVPAGATMTFGAVSSANGVLNIATSAVFVVQDGANLVINNVSATGASLPGGGNIRGAGPNSTITLGPGALGATIPGGVFSNPFIGSLVTSAGPEMTLTQPGITMGTGLADDARFTAGGPVAIGANANFTFNNTTAGRLIASGAGSIRAADPTTSRFTFGANANGGDINGCIFANPWTGTMITNSAMAISPNCRLVLGAPGSFDGVLNLGGTLTLTQGGAGQAGGNLVINNRNPDFIVLPGLQPINPVGVAGGAANNQNGRLTIGPSALSTTANVAVIPNSRIGTAFSVNSGGFTGTVASSTGTALITTGTLVISAPSGALRVAGEVSGTFGSNTVFSTSNQVLLGQSATLNVLATEAGALGGAGVVQGTGVNSQVVFGAAANNSIIPGNNFGQHYLGQIYTNSVMTLNGNLRLAPAYSFAMTTGASLQLGGTLTVAAGARLDVYNNLTGAGTVLAGVIPAAGAFGGTNAGNPLVPNFINPAVVMLGPGFGTGALATTTIAQGANPVLTPTFNGALITSTGTATISGGNLVMGTPDAAGVAATTGTLEIGGPLRLGAAVALTLNNTTYRSSTGKLSHDITTGTPAEATINMLTGGSSITLANGFNGGYFPVTYFGANTAITPTCGAAYNAQRLGGGIGNGQLNILGPSALQMINGGFNANTNTSLDVNGTLQFGNIAGASAAGNLVIATGATLSATSVQNIDVANRGRISAIDPTGTFNMPSNALINTAFPILGAGATGFTGRVRVNGTTNPGTVISGVTVAIAPSGTLDLCGPYLSLANVASSILNLNNTGANTLTGTGIILGTSATNSVVNFGAGFNAGILDGNKFQPGGTTPGFGGRLNLGSTLTLSAPLTVAATGQFDLTGNGGTGNDLILGNNTATFNGTVSNQTSTQYFVTNGSGELRLANVGSNSFYVGPSATVFAPVTIVNNGTPATFGARALTAVTQATAFATGSTTLRLSNVNQQWTVTQVNNVIAGSAVSISPSWVAGQEGAGFNRTVAVTTAYPTTPVSSSPAPAVSDPIFPGFFRSSVTISQTASNLLNGTSVLVTSQPSPAISFFTPTAQSSGNTIRIIGSRFVSTAAVSLGGIAVPASGVLLRAGSGGALDTLVVTVPSTARSGDVVVTQAGGNSTLAGFIMLGAPAQQPTIFRVLPSPIPAGIGDVITTITGAAFGLNTPRVVAVGNGLTATLVPTANSLTSITVNVPAELVRNPGTLQLTLTSVERLPVSTNVTIIVAPPIALASITPSSTTGNLNPFAIEVSGSSFSAQSAFTIGSARLRVLGVTQNADGTLTARVEAPVGVQTGNLTVTNVNGQSASLPFQVNALPRPVISSVNPPLIPPGSPDVVVTVRGRFLIPGATATFNGQPLSGGVLVGDSVFTVTIPAALLTNPDLAVLTITNPDGQSIGYRLPITTAAPGSVSLSLTGGLTPNVTTASGSAFTITINGTGFAGTPRVFVGGQSITVASTSDTRLTAIVPGSLNQTGLSPTVYAVQVVNPSGVSSNALMLTINPNTTTPPPAITRVNTSANNLTIIGTGFATGARVALGSTQLTVSSLNATQIVAGLAAGLTPGTYTLTVTNPDGQVATQTLVITSVSNEPLAGVRVYPNPVVEQVTVSANIERAAKVVITVTNSLGQRVIVEEHTAAAGFFSRNLNIGNLPTGAYMVEITDGTRRSVEKIVKN